MFLRLNHEARRERCFASDYEMLSKSKFSIRPKAYRYGMRYSVDPCRFIPLRPASLFLVKIKQATIFDSILPQISRRKALCDKELKNLQNLS